MLRIPRRVSLPFGYIITVKQVDDSEMNQLASDCDGLWNVETQTIILRKRLPIKYKAYILTHELMHAVADWQHDLFGEGEVKP